MLTQLSVLTALTILPPLTVRPPARVVYKPRVEVWTNRGDAAVYTRGDGVRVYFRVDQDAYVTLFRVDTDGRVRVIFPREPWEDNYVRGGREFEVEGRSGGDAFSVDDYPGVGYVFGVAAADPFVYDPIESGDHWDYRTIADGRVRGDPYVALTDLAQRIVPEGYSDWDYDIVSYDVQQHYDYPRFLCYDCHAYASWSYWNPYSYSCVRFRIVVFDDPYYYPYRYYGGTRVVFVRPFRPEPRFIFKDWGTVSRDRFVTRERERPVNDDTRRGVRGRDLGGVGAIPAPREMDRRGRPGGEGQPGGNQEHPQGRRDDDRGRRTGEPRTGGDRNGRPDQPDRRGESQDRRTVPDRPDRPVEQPGRDRGRPDKSGPPGLVEPRRGGESRPEPRSEPRVAPRNEPRDQPRAEPRRAEPRNEPRSTPRAEPRSQPRNQPRAEPRAEPRKSSPPARSQPELRRRKP